LLHELSFDLVRQRTHKIYRNPDGLTFVTASTPSDSQASRNALSTLNLGHYPKLGRLENPSPLLGNSNFGEVGFCPHHLTQESPLHADPLHEKRRGSHSTSEFRLCGPPQLIVVLLEPLCSAKTTKTRFPARLSLQNPAQNP
jgi:hypothetical protein